MSEPAASSTMAATDGADLARRAAQAIAARLAGRPLDGRPPAAATLRALGATFVTLEAAGALLGCIGSIDAGRPIYIDAMHNAVRASVDPRLPPVTPAQWNRVDVKVSVLSRPEPIDVTDRAELLALLRPGVDGLVLADDRRRATFLPSVWRKVPEPAKFLAALLDKGGWPRAVRIDGGWPVGLLVRRYTVVEFIDPAPR